MDGIACALNKKCRESKSKEIVSNMSNEEKTYEEIYKDINASKSDDTVK